MATVYLIHDRYGRRLGTVDQIDRDILTVHNRYGRRIGTLTPDPSGEAAIEDCFGRNIVTVNPREPESRSNRPDIDLPASYNQAHRRYQNR